MKFIQNLVQKYQDAKQKAANKKQFRISLLEAVSDGRLTKEEIDNLEVRKSELGLSDSDITEIRSEVFTVAFNSAKSDASVTKEEEQELNEIQKYLGLGDEQVGATKKELARFRLLNEIQHGNMPIIPQIANVLIKKGEKIYWSEPCALAEEKVVRRSYQGSSSGVSFRVMKGVSYRIGGARGHLVSETDIVAVSHGDLIITSDRIIFRGDKKSFASKLENLLDIQLFNNGFQFSENNKAKPRLLKFNQPGNHDIIGAVLSYAINHLND